MTHANWWKDICLGALPSAIVAPSKVGHGLFCVPVCVCVWLRYSDSAGERRRRLVSGKWANECAEAKFIDEVAYKFER